MCVSYTGDVPKRRKGLPSLFGTSQLMRYLKVSRQSILRYVHDERLVPIIKERRYWVFTKEEVDRFKREVWPHLHPGPGRKGARRG